jgi:putative ABC transport system permease protein
MPEILVRDVRQALRSLSRSPAFALTAVAALALGIGVNTAIFSVVNAVLLRPLAFPHADRLVFFMSTSSQGSNTLASPVKFQHYREQEAVVEGASAFMTGVVNFTGGTFPEQMSFGRVSREFFGLFGAPTLLGRTFTPEDDRPGGPRVAVLSRGLWATRFGSDPGVLGRSLSLGGEPYTIVGVLGSFDFADLGGDPQVWLPFQLDPNTRDQGHYFRVAGRLEAGVSLEEARARVRASRAAFDRRFPGALLPQNGFDVQPVGEVLVRGARKSLLVLAGAVAFVLLIACANVASLLLVRATTRRREVAIRCALGGSRWRIARQVLTESVVLSLAGGALGLVLGTVGMRALLAVNTAGLPRIGENGSGVSLDARVLGFTLVLSVATGLLFGLIPALQSSRADLASTLKETGSRSGSGGLRQNKTRAMLVVSEVALALTLLVGSALLIRTAIALGHVDPGFDARHVLTMRMSFKGDRFAASEAVEQVIRTGIDRLRALPGVVSASATCCIPLEGGYGLPFTIVGRPTTNGPYHGGGQWMTASPGYFEVFKIPVKRGRVFDRRDDGHAPPVVVINETMAKRFWPGRDPVGEQLVIGRGVMREFASERERQIIGVVGDTRDGGLNQDPGPAMFIPQAQVPDAANALNVGLGPMGWVVRTVGAPMAMSTAVQEELRRATGLPVSDVRTMAEVVSRSTSRDRFNMWLMTVFGLAALLLAALGIYGLMAYSVAQRTQELGIRMALGAESAHVRRMVVAQGMGLAAIGGAIGLAAAFGLARVIDSFLFGVTRSDPLVFSGVPVVLAAVALLAVWLPATRASRVDPVEALRYE